MNQTGNNGSPINATFADFWNLYPKKVSRKDAMKAWDKLPFSDRTLALEKLPAHVAYWSATTERQFIPYPATWLNGERWHDELEMPAPKPDTGWKTTEQGILREGARRGLTARPGESLWEFRARIEAA